MQQISAQKLTMQINHVNALFEDPKTPNIQIRLKLFLLDNMLDNFDAEKATAQELKTCAF